MISSSLQINFQLSLLKWDFLSTFQAQFSLEKGGNRESGWSQNYP